jgi:ribonuclease Z
MRIEVIGSGEAFDCTHGNTAFYLSDARLLIDCGYQVPERVWKRSLIVDAVLLTHLHADHCFGLVPLLVREHEEGRKKSFTILGPQGVARSVRSLLELGYPGLCLKFRVRFVELKAGRRSQFNGYLIESAATEHSIPNLAHRVFKPKGKSVGISGDGALTEESLALLSRCDLVFQEAYTRRPSPWKHADVDSLNQYDPSTLDRIVLTHLSRKDRRLITQFARTRGIRVARAGETYRI